MTTENTASQPITLTEIANNPKGITKRKLLAQALNVHPLTISRWIKSNQFPKPTAINRIQYFKNADVLAWLEKQGA